MQSKLKFWALMALFQIAFGVTIFTITRQYYSPESTVVDAGIGGQASQLMPQGIMNSDPTQLNSATFEQLSINDPAEISRRANEFFGKKQYGRAAEMYQRLIELAPNNVDTYNNLGITLHYLGKPAEALRRLDEGVAIDPAHQRSWLTMGYVNSQLGNIEQARAALGKAASMNADNDIGKSAIKMLAELP